MSTERLPIGQCPFCGSLVYDGDRRYYEVLGWEASRKQGGTNAIRLRERTSQVAHDRCVDRVAHGHQDQPLF